ncbi:MAG: hypothetical protein AAF488_02460 [Planctomycetota bacterium]
MTRTFLGPAMAALILSTTACEPESMAPLGFHRATIETARTGEISHLWLALPGVYQDDVDQCVRSFSDRLGGGSELYDRSFELMAKLGRLLAERRNYLVGSPALQQHVGASDAPAADPMAKMARDTLEVLRSLGELLPEIPADAQAATKPAEQMQVESRGEKTAVVRIDLDGKEPFRQEMIEVEGKWVPKALADRWQEIVGSVRERLSNLELSKKDRFLAPTYLTLLDNTVDGLLDSKSQEEFDQRLAPLLTMLFNR